MELARWYEGDRVYLVLIGGGGGGGGGSCDVDDSDDIAPCLGCKDLSVQLKDSDDDDDDEIGGGGMTKDEMSSSRDKFPLSRPP